MLNDNVARNGGNMDLLSIAQKHWLASYMCIGLVAFIINTVRNGIAPGGWSNSSGGKPIYSGGLYEAFWQWVMFWPLMLLLVIGFALHEMLTRK